ncbi:nuclear transport factor 2 family protein [Crocinitomix algicola]|uniref:nuclear transport factor 2 family protein n=1 Tax=Crocinitomix algicola TaxID=1740263 RepID=UPI0009F42E7F|nr:nuclear transport factor 2 family protein [Crocinitomix algicola]
MKRIILWILFIPVSNLYSQLDIVEKTIEFYAALNKGDSIDVRPFLHDHATVNHTSINGMLSFSSSNFLLICEKFKSGIYAEEIVRIEAKEGAKGFYAVDVYFQFYLDGSYYKSGVDHICWTYKNKVLKIDAVYSSYYDDDISIAPSSVALDRLMDQWHHDVGIFDFDAYFDFMSEGFIFLGTDPSERWTKKEFMAFAKPYFDEKSTWLFTKNWRNWYFSDDHSIAWFEESLDTWMEECRGSGVLKKINGEWKIVHYNLSVVIENEKMKKFIKLRRK